MIRITRILARQLRAVFRRLAGRAPAVRPVVAFHADAAGLCVRLQRTPILAEYREAGDFGAGTLTVPIDVLTECEGRDDSSVSLEAAELTTLSASWLDHGMPQIKHYQVDDEQADFPACPDQLSRATPGLLAALANASIVLPASPSATPSSISSFEVAQARSWPPTAGSCWFNVGSPSRGQTIC